MKTRLYQILAVISCAIMIFSISACKPSKDKDSSTDSSTSKTSDKNDYSDVEIELYVDLHGWMPTLNEEATAENPTVFRSPQLIADAFTKKHPNIKIKWARTKPVGGDNAELAEWFTTQINAGTVPAIAFSWGTQYQDRGWYLDLDKYLDEVNEYVDGDKKWSDLFPSYLWNQNTIKSAKGSVVAVPIALYPGPATGYYYNKEAFTTAGISETPKTWEQLVNADKKLREKGFTGIGPWGHFKQVDTGTWIAQFCLSSALAGAIMDKTDYDKNDIVETAEQLRATLAGIYNPVEHEYSKEYYRQQKRYFTEILPKGWEGTEYSSLWNEGKLGMKEEGLWALQNEENNKTRDFDYGVFPAPLMSTDTSEFAKKIEYTESGPYQPSADLQLNIMSAAVKDKPEMLDAAVKFLKFLTTPENNGMMVLEQGSDIGAVIGADVPPILATWLAQPFPKIPKADWPNGFTEEQTLAINKNFQNYVSGAMSEGDFFTKVNELQQKGANDYIKNMKIDTSGW